MPSGPQEDYDNEEDKLDDKNFMGSQNEAFTDFTGLKNAL